MGLNNIQKSKKKVLDRPMFAKMRNGELKKILYAQFYDIASCFQ